MTEEALKDEICEYVHNIYKSVPLYGFSKRDLRDVAEHFALPREKQIAELGERCLQLQKDKGNLTDRVRELEEQIEKMKSDVIKSFGSEYNVLVAKLLKEWEIKEK